MAHVQTIRNLTNSDPAAILLNVLVPSLRMV